MCGVGVWWPNKRKGSCLVFLRQKFQLRWSVLVSWLMLDRCSRKVKDRRSWIPLATWFLSQRKRDHMILLAYVNQVRCLLLLLKISNSPKKHGPRLLLSWQSCSDILLCSLVTHMLIPFFFAKQVNSHTYTHWYFFANTSVDMCFVKRE